MKIALIGKGKTGGEILNLHPKGKVVIFDSKNEPTLEGLKECDVAISFVPGNILLGYIPILIDSKIPVVSGSTGHEWPTSFESALTEKQCHWISGSNFSLGMRLIHKMIQHLSKASELFENYHFNIHEIHHEKKVDAPSGTAKSWHSWLNQESPITYERKGDIVGDHSLNLKTSFEEITLNHVALDRKVFAEGALWAANYLLKTKASMEPGLYLFEDITEKQLTHGLLK